MKNSYCILAGQQINKTAFMKNWTLNENTFKSFENHYLWPLNQHLNKIMYVDNFHKVKNEFHYASGHLWSKVSGTRDVHFNQLIRILTDKYNVKRFKVTYLFVFVSVIYQNISKVFLHG